MSKLIAIGYPQEATAQRARDEVNQLIQRPDTTRAIIRNGQGSVWVAANPYGLAVRIIWGMVWGLLVGLGFGTGLGVVVGAGLGAVLAKVDRSGVNRAFQGRVPAHAQARHLHPGGAGGTGDLGRGRRGPQPLWG
jgi:uncharacterized membrane protein